MLEILWLCLL